MKPRGQRAHVQTARQSRCRGCSGFLTDGMFLCFQLDRWPRFISARFHYTIYPITFSVGDAEEWKKLFKPCAAQRLFLPVSNSWNLLRSQRRVPPA